MDFTEQGMPAELRNELAAKPELAALFAALPTAEKLRYVEFVANEGQAEERVSRAKEAMRMLESKEQEQPQNG